MPRRFMVVLASKEVSLLSGYVNTVMKQEHTKWIVKPWSSKTRKAGQHILCFCVKVKTADRRKEEKRLFALLISEREAFEW